MPIARHEELVRLAPVVDRPKNSVRSRLIRTLVHQLEVEVEVVDRVPAKVRADQPGRRGGRERAGAGRGEGATDSQEAAAATLIAPLQLADRAFEVEIELRR